MQGYAWFANSLVYFGLFLAANDLGGSIYRNFIILSVADIPFAFLGIYFCERVGRKKTIVISMLAGGAACIAIAFVPSEAKLKYARIVFGRIGKSFILISFNGLYTWSAEIYPTNIRCVGNGYLEMACRVGGAASPWIAKGLQFIHKSAPFIVMGLVTITASLLCLSLPETKGKKTSEYFNDKEDIRNNVTMPTSYKMECSDGSE